MKKYLLLYILYQNVIIDLMRYASKAALSLAAGAVPKLRSKTGFKIVTGVLTGINRSQIDFFSIKVAQIIQHQVKDFAPTIAIIYLLHLHQIN